MTMKVLVSQLDQAIKRLLDATVAKDINQDETKKRLEKARRVLDGVEHRR